MLPLDEIDGYEHAEYAHRMRARLEEWMTYDKWMEDTLYESMAHMCLLVLLKMAK